MPLASSDAHVRRAAPASNAAAAARLLLRGAGTSNDEYAYLHFTPPFPSSGATILAASLHLFRAGAWTGTKTVNVRRVTGTWGESNVNWNNKPAVDTAFATTPANAGADNSEIVVDVTAIMQAVANSAPYFGLRVDVTQDAEVAVRSSEAGTSALRPRLDVVWSAPPDAPDKLSPDGNDAVSKTQPLLVWQAAEQTSYQVQVSTASDFSTLSLDTGKTAGGTTALDTSLTSLPAVATGSSRYWRVRVWNDADVVSAWSAAAQWQRQPLAALAITSPGATTPVTAPQVAWTFGATQTRWQVTLWRVEANGSRTVLWKALGADATLAQTVPYGLIKTGVSYLVGVSAWDGVSRSNDEHATATQAFTYVRGGGPAPPTGLAAAAYIAGETGASPAVVLTWQRATPPDYWSLRVGGVEVDTTIDVAACSTGGTGYRMVWWGLVPRRTVTVEIEAVVEGTGASGPNPTVSVTPNPVGIWLVDDSSPGATSGDAVQLLGDDAADLAIGETATTYDPVGSQVPVRITDSVRGYEGSVSGYVTTSAARDTFLDVKASAATTPMRLILSDVSIPVWLEAVYARPTPLPLEQQFECGFAFFQVGEPWPVPA